MRERAWRSGAVAGLCALGLSLTLAAAPMAALAEEVGPVAAEQPAAADAPEALAVPAPAAGDPFGGGAAVAGAGQAVTDAEGGDTDAPVSADSVPSEGEGSDDVLLGDDAAVTDDVAGSGDAVVAEDDVVSPEDGAVDDGAATDAAADDDPDDGEASDDAAIDELSADDDTAASALASGQAGWRLEDGSWRWYAEGADEASTGWLVTSLAPGSASEGDLQRYWLDAAGKLVSSALVDVGDGLWAYSRPEGFVVRGKWVDPTTGYVYLADNDGMLESPGWVVTDAYGDGLQRYWVSASSHAAEPGYSADGWDHYTTERGYVLRGASAEGDEKRWADNDGRLTMSGWLVTGEFTHGTLQRYWVEDGTVARNQLISASDAGYWAYATSDGTVLRGKLVIPDVFGLNGVFLSDNDGRFVSEDGWLVTGTYDNGALQRYYIESSDKGFFYALTGIFRRVLGGSGEVAFYGDESQGYVLRGKKDTSNGVLLADNDGVIASVAGDGDFLVTNKYDGSMQRYYLRRVGEAYYAQTGRIDVGDSHYYGIQGSGYVLRGTLRVGDGMLLADNDGVLAWEAGWLVTDKYTGAGNVERYRIDDSPGSGLMGARVGLFTVDGADYFGRDDTGYVVRGYYVPRGTTTIYYGDNDGKLQEHGWLEAVGERAWARIWYKSSATRYLLVVDCDNCYTFVFEGSAGNWMPKFIWRCGTGLPIYNDGQGTVRGEYEIGGSGACYNWADWASGKDDYKGGYQTPYYAKDDIRWYTNFVLDLGFHSTIGWDGGYSDPNQIGRKISHGCIRLLEENAKWIYYNCAVGTKVITY